MQVVFRDDSDHGIVGPGRRSQRREAPGVFLEVPGWIESSALRGSTLALVVQVHTTRMNWLRKMMGSSGSRPAQPTPGEDPPLKTISYRGGVVTFRIPAHWLEEHDPKPEPPMAKRAYKSKTLHRWRQRQQRPRQ